jgi:DtxR family Mn-dependent transcriptional regulator
MPTNISQSIEDYIKAIYKIAGDDGRASTNQLAEYLEVTPASVTGMIQKLSAAEKPLLDYQKHRGVVLTPKGKKVALETLRHHRLLEVFLHEILDFPWDEVHEEADHLEHVISEKFEERMAIALGNPKHDPHGDPIPRRDLSMPSSAGTSLIDLRPGQQAIVKRVQDDDPNLLRHLSEQGVIPQAKIEIIDFSTFDKNLHLRVGNNPNIIVLGPQITGQIYVEETR